MPNQNHRHRAVLALPHIRVQGANAISSPLTWGFPAITAFTGLAIELERKLGSDAGISILGVAPVCHDFQAMTTEVNEFHLFHQALSPLTKARVASPINTEGKIHLELTLLFEVLLSDEMTGEAERRMLALDVGEVMQGLTVAGGSVMPSLNKRYRRLRPFISLIPDESNVEERDMHLRGISRACSPGFVLVSRDDLLAEKLTEMRAETPSATLIDAFMEFSSITERAVLTQEDETCPTSASHAAWVRDKREGWVVPIPVGFTGISTLYEPGTVRGARSADCPVRFAEAIYSLGQWVSPKKLNHLSDFFWTPATTPDVVKKGAFGTYRCINSYGG